MQSSVNLGTRCFWARGVSALISPAQQRNQKDIMGCDRQRHETKKHVSERLRESRHAVAVEKQHLSFLNLPSVILAQSKAVCVRQMVCDFFPLGCYTSFVFNRDPGL